MKDTQLIDLFQKARKDPNFVIIEGVQALKHAVRFGAEIQYYITCDIDSVTKLIEELAKDITKGIRDQITTVDEAVFSKLSPTPHRTKVIALAKRTSYTTESINPNKPIVLLEEPRDLENIGAVIRVSAAADVAAVCITGPVDIWNPAVVRGAAGLHFAVPVFNAQLSKFLDEQKTRQLISLDPTGTVIQPQKIPKNAVLIFGTERHGISQETLSKSDEIVSLPMQPGVSSLNLATSVAATLYQL